MNGMSIRGSAKWRVLAILIALFVLATPYFFGAGGNAPLPEIKAPGAVLSAETSPSEVSASKSPWAPDFTLPPPTSLELGEMQEVAFVAENTVAMQSMMAAMTVEPSGDVDRDFVEMMVPHHQGAIDMAAALLRYGSNERLKRLAQEIIVTQQEEIVAMRLAVGDRLPPSATETVEQLQAATQ